MLRLSPVFDYIDSWTVRKCAYVAFFWKKSTQAGGKLDIGVTLIMTAVKDRSQAEQKPCDVKDLS